MLHTKKNAFSMIELVFVIVILGILAAIAVPKFAATRTDAQITKGRADISSIRSAIVSERQTRLIKGDASWISKLSDNNDTLFTGSDENHTLLMYGINSGTSDGDWRVTDDDKKHYAFKIGDTDCDFDYNSTNGKFNLTTSSTLCDQLVK